MRRRPILISLLLAAALCGARAATADLRQELGADNATLIEGVAAQLYPGSHIEWVPELALVAGTTRRGLRVGGIDVRRDANGYTGAVAFELTDGRAEIVAAIDAYQATPSHSPAEIAAFKANSALAVTEVRRATLADPAAALEQVEDISLTALTYSRPWPDVYVTYTGLYGTADFRGDITWDEKITFDPDIAATGRAAAFVSRRDKDSSIERSDRVIPAVVDDTTISFSSATSNHVISRCTDPCLPDGRVLLALWWTTARVVATP
jgi:hypothetical protein